MVSGPLSDLPAATGLVHGTVDLLAFKVQTVEIGQLTRFLSTTDCPYELTIFNSKSRTYDEHRWKEKMSME